MHSSHLLAPFYSWIISVLLVYFTEPSVAFRLSTTTRVFLENYCENVYSAITAEELLAIDSKHVQEWWRPLNFPFFKKIAHPLCSPYPNLMRGTDVPISSHEFFHRRNIFIPLMTGHVSTRLHHYQHQIREPIWRQFLDCECRPMNTMYPYEELCQQGQISLSRGVGGDTSFFIHKRDVDGRYNVVAHICFPQDDFKEPSKIRSALKYAGAAAKKVLYSKLKLRSNENPAKTRAE